MCIDCSFLMSFFRKKIAMKMLRIHGFRQSALNKPQNYLNQNLSESNFQPQYQITNKETIKLTLLVIIFIVYYKLYKKNMSEEHKLKQMHELAFESRSRAYCPYSRFAVGACILGADGKYYTGCNVERAVGSVCAQGTAIVKMVESGCRELKEVYVVTELSGEMLAAPCGFCRQFIKEFSKNDEQVLVHLGSVKHGYQKSIKFSILLPYSFGPASLNIKAD